MDRADSTVNVVIGARRFIAGWNSWRVSTMGLMHVGVGEGPEIIQMFGRGVRLKGRDMSLKRHRESGAEPPADGDRLAELETLRIFGLRATYMQTFRELLQKDGIGVERETVILPVTWNFARKDLRIIRLRKGREVRPVRRPPRPCRNPAARTAQPSRWTSYSRLQAVESGAVPAGVGAEKALVTLPRHSRRPLRPDARLRLLCLARKRRMGWHNLAIERETVDALLDLDDWYTLYLPPERCAPKRLRGRAEAGGNRGRI